MAIQNVVQDLEDKRGVFFKLGEAVSLYLAGKNGFFYANINLREGDDESVDVAIMPLATNPLLKTILEDGTPEELAEEMGFMYNSVRGIAANGLKFVSALKEAARDDFELINREFEKFRDSPLTKTYYGVIKPEKIIRPLDRALNIITLWSADRSRRRMVHTIAENCLGWLILDRACMNYCRMLEADAGFIEETSEPDEKECWETARLAKISSDYYRQISSIAEGAAHRFSSAIKNIRQKYEPWGTDMKLPDLAKLADRYAGKIGYKGKKKNQ